MSNKTIQMPASQPVESSTLKIKKLRDVNVGLPVTKVVPSEPRAFPIKTKMEETGVLATSKPAQYHIWIEPQSFHTLFAISGDPKRDATFLKFLPPFTRPVKPNDVVYQMRQLAFYSKGNKIFNLAYVDGELLSEPYVVNASRDFKKGGKFVERNFTWTVMVPVGVPISDDRLARLIERFCYAELRIDAIDTAAVVTFLLDNNESTDPMILEHQEEEGRNAD